MYFDTSKPNYKTISAMHLQKELRNINFSVVIQDIYFIYEKRKKQMNVTKILNNCT